MKIIIQKSGLDTDSIIVKFLADDEEIPSEGITVKEDELKNYKGTIKLEISPKKIEAKQRAEAIKQLLQLLQTHEMQLEELDLSGNQLIFVDLKSFTLTKATERFTFKRLNLANNALYHLDGTYSVPGKRLELSLQCTQFLVAIAKFNWIEELNLSNNPLFKSNPANPALNALLKIILKIPKLNLVNICQESFHFTVPQLNSFLPKTKNGDKTSSILVSSANMPQEFLKSSSAEEPALPDQFDLLDQKQRIQNRKDELAAQQQLDGIKKKPRLKPKEEAESEVGSQKKLSSIPDVELAPEQSKELTARFPSYIKIINNHITIITARRWASSQSLSVPDPIFLDLKRLNEEQKKFLNEKLTENFLIDGLMLPDGQLSCFSAALHKNSTLKMLDLSNLTIGDDFFPTLIGILQNRKAPLNLKLNYTVCNDLRFQDFVKNYLSAKDFNERDESESNFPILIELIDKDEGLKDKPQNILTLMENLEAVYRENISAKSEIYIVINNQKSIEYDLDNRYLRNNAEKASLGIITLGLIEGFSNSEEDYVVLTPCYEQYAYFKKVVEDAANLENEELQSSELKEEQEEPKKDKEENDTKKTDGTQAEVHNSGALLSTTIAVLENSQVESKEVPSVVGNVEGGGKEEASSAPKDILSKKDKKAAEDHKSGVSHNTTVENVKRVVSSEPKKLPKKGVKVPGVNFIAKMKQYAEKAESHLVFAGTVIERNKKWMTSGEITDQKQASILAKFFIRHYIYARDSFFHRGTVLQRTNNILAWTLLNYVQLSNAGKNPLCCQALFDRFKKDYSQNDQVQQLVAVYEKLAKKVTKPLEFVAVEIADRGQPSGELKANLNKALEQAAKKTSASKEVPQKLSAAINDDLASILNNKEIDILSAALLGTPSGAAKNLDEETLAAIYYELKI